MIKAEQLMKEMTKIVAEKFEEGWTISPENYSMTNVLARVDMELGEEKISIRVNKIYVCYDKLKVADYKYELAIVDVKRSHFEDKERENVDIKQVWFGIDNSKMLFTFDEMLTASKIYENKLALSNKKIKSITPTKKLNIAGFKRAKNIVVKRFPTKYEIIDLDSGKEKTVYFK